MALWAVGLSPVRFPDSSALHVVAMRLSFQVSGVAAGRVVANGVVNVVPLRDVAAGQDEGVACRDSRGWLSVHPTDDLPVAMLITEAHVGPAGIGTT